MENLKEIVWTKRALNDLRNAYDFNTKIYGEVKSYEIIETVIARIGMLKDQRFTEIGSTDDDFQHLKLAYRKLVVGHLKVNYRESSDKTIVFINRIFDTRQSPQKNK